MLPSNRTVPYHAFNILSASLYMSKEIIQNFVLLKDFWFGCLELLLKKGALEVLGFFFYFLFFFTNVFGNNVFDESV